MVIYINIEEQLNNELTKSIQMQKEMQDLIDELVTENNFLSDTITANKLGKITIERRDLQLQMQRIQKEADKKLSEAKKIRSKYEQVTSEIENIKNRISDKEENIDKYIASKATKQISAKIEELEQEKINCKTILNKHISENNEKTNAQIFLYKQKRKKWILALLISIIITLISISINFI